MALPQMEENYAMQQRRINLDEDRRHDALKELAGRIQKLSYTDMKRFAVLMAGQDQAEGFADKLIIVASQILNEK